MCKVLSEKYDVEKFTPHDLRRTGATYMASSLKVERYIISQILNHTSDNGGAGAATNIYARYDYLEEKRTALIAWSEFLLENATSHS